VSGQDDRGWSISPTKINIQLGEDRPLQLLDANAKELHGAIWSIDKPNLAEIREENSGIVVHPKAVGTVRVSAALSGEMRFQDVTIWSPVRPLPEGLTRWSMESIGRDIGDLPAVPTGDGPSTFSLEQNPTGTYLRASSSAGIQVWTWRMPENVHDVDLVCGDWLGGALISANRADSYTLYAVGKNGKLRWRRTLAGTRKGHAYSLDHLVHVLSQSPDGTVSSVTGIDEVTGAQRFQLMLPTSHIRQVNVRKDGMRAVCVSAPLTGPLRTLASRLFVNIDGFAYVAFTQNEWTLSTAECISGAIVDRKLVNFEHHDKVVLWQIHPDGTYRSTVVEEVKNTRSLGEPVSAISPTGGLIPDGLGGELLSIRWTHNWILEDVTETPDQFVYRIDEEGQVVYKFPLPPHDNSLHDDMVLGESDLGFATRGGTLVAFDVRTGKERWAWDSTLREISVFAALANGGCIVKTPTGLVQVEEGGKTKSIAHGDAFLGWDGQMYRTH
jgi:outer membrane protein assembly factor BamB